MKKMKYILLALCVFSFESFAKQESDKKEDIEVIEVYGSVPLSLIKKELQAKRFEFMEFFNSHVTDKDLKFVCKKETGQRLALKKNVCRNAYDIRIRREVFRDKATFAENVSELIVASDLSKAKTAENDQRDKDKVAAIQKMLAQQQEFSTLLTEYKALEEKYKTVHKKEFGKLSGYEEND